MIKDFLRRKKIVEKSTSIAEEIMGRYSPEMDQVRGTESKAEIKKKRRLLLKVLQSGRADITRTIREMGLGVYGKARFYKTIQDNMLNKGYSEASARTIIEELIRRF